MKLRMSLSYYQCDWIHPESEEPVVVYYEVDAVGDVPRLIDVFADGRRQCMAVIDVALLGRNKRRITSLVEGSFYDGIAGLVDGLFFEEGQGAHQHDPHRRREIRERMAGAPFGGARKITLALPQAPAP